MVAKMKSFEEFSRERVSMIISLSREGISQSAVLPWDSDAEELIGAFVKMLWVAEYPPSWFPEILRELADTIETDLNPEKGKMEAELELLRELEKAANTENNEVWNKINQAKPEWDEQSTHQAKTTGK